MNFSSAQKVLGTIRAGDDVEWIRQENRVKITRAANCAPPLDEKLCKKIGLKINIEWGELMTALAHATRQYLSAFLGNEHFFKVTLPLAPAEHQTEWGDFITDQINRPMRNSIEWFHIELNRWKSVPAHGIGPMEWTDPYSWCTRFIALNDFRVPTDTTIGFEDLEWYATREGFTPFGLVQEVFNERPNNHWNKKEVARLLKNIKNVNWDYPQNNYNWETDAEKLAELVRQNGGYYASDALPRIPLWRFYFHDFADNGDSGWFLVIVPDAQAVKGGADNDKFLWKSDEPVAKDWKELLHVQFGDLATNTPLMVHSIRSLGFALLEPCFYTNLTRNRALQHLHDNLVPWLRITDPVEKARPVIQEFGNNKVLRTGVNIVTQDQRHQIDSGLFENIMAQLKQLQQEASATYTQQIDTGTKKEQTAFETRAKLEQVNAMMSGLLLQAFKYETQAYREICRRFCLRGSTDKDVQVFQRHCKQAQIPRRWLNIEYWDIEPVTPLGMGNPTMAMAEAKELLEIRPTLPPSAQQEALHDAITVQFGARRAARWAPLRDNRRVTKGQEYVGSMFGTLMQGIELPVPEGISMIEQFDGIEKLYAGKIAMMEKRDNMATVDEQSGLMAVSKYAHDLIQLLEQDPQEVDQAKKFGDSLKELDNLARGLIQRGQQQRAQQSGNGNGGLSPEAQAKIHATMATAAAKLHATQQKDALKQRQNSERFVREERRKDAGAFAEIQRESVKNRMKAFEE